MGALISIRQAGKGDFPHIVDMLHEVRLPVDGLTPGMPDLYVSETNSGSIVGCAALESEGSFGFLRSLVVRPSMQGEGVGERLVAAIHDRACVLGLEAVYLLTTTAEDYFPRFGYERSIRTNLPTAVTGSDEFSDCTAAGATIMRAEIKRTRGV